MITFVGKLLADTDEAAQGGLNARTKEWNLWFIAVCVEHSVLIGRVLILTVLPATPGWIETAKKQLDFGPIWDFGNVWSGNWKSSKYEDGHLDLIIEEHVIEKCTFFVDDMAQHMGPNS